MDTVASLTALDQAGPGAARLGARAQRLARMRGQGLPVPSGVVLMPEAVQDIADGGRVPDLSEDIGTLVALRNSVEQRGWGGPQAILNLGLTDAALPELADRIGERGVLEAYFRAIRSFGTRVSGIDPGDFDALYYDQTKLTQFLGAQELAEIVTSAKALYLDETGEAFPQTLEAQLAPALRAMAREWSSPSAKILREARGAPEDAGLAIIVQRMVFGLGDQRSGAGSYQPVNSATGAAQPTGRFLPDAQGGDAGRGVRTPHQITESERREAGQTQPSLEALEPDVYATLVAVGEGLKASDGDAFEVQFTVEAGALWVLDADPARRSPRAAVRVAVDLAKEGAISREDAILRIDPRAVTETLHPQVDPTARRDVISRGLPASPGAATGIICFSPNAAMAAQAQGDAAILVRPETSPEDIRGMHAAAGLLTARGGMTSHAAVIARGIGLPCVVGANDLSIDVRKRRLRSADGRVFEAGETITLDGTNGEALFGAPAMLPAEPTKSLDALMDWDRALPL